MKIAYINADAGVPAFGSKGCSVHVQEMLRAMLAAGHHVHLYTVRVGDVVRLTNDRLHVHTIESSAAREVADREGAAMAVNTPLHDSLAEEHAVEPFDLVYERQSLWSYAAMEFAKEHNIASILEVNAPLIEEQSSHRTLIDRASAELCRNRAFSAATVIAAVSSPLAQQLENHSSARGKVHVVPNAVNVTRFENAAPARPRKEGEFVFGFVGTLKPWHGVSTLIASFAVVAQRSANARLLIIGDGPERDTLENDVRARSLQERVCFAGAVSPDEVPAWLASMDVAVAPYPALETFYFSPLKLYEYMAAGVPVVASRIGQIAEVIQDGETGVLVPPSDGAALSAALIRLQNEPHFREQLAAAARIAVQHRTWEHVFQHLLGLAGLNLAVAPKS
jgi:glycosyltransferase involved in cell wall biosynthesis